MRILIVSRTFLPSLFCLLLAASVAMAGELDRFTGLSGNLDIAGGTAHIPVMKEAAKRIMTANPNIRITVAGGGSGVGVQQVGEGLVAIGNTGPGIPPDEVGRVFERFYRADKARNRRVDGTGLGLNLAREIARAHGGDLLLTESRAGWTAFELVLPAAAPEA